MSPIKANIKRQHRRSGKAGTEQPLREIRNDVAGIDITAALRNLQRMRHTLRQSQDDWIRRIQKQLGLMNVRVHRAVSDITGLTGMLILRSILAGGAPAEPGGNHVHV